MLEIIAATGLSTATGLFGHFVFYPIIEAFNNQRMRRLARPSIGVLLNIVPFLAWLQVFKKITIYTAFAAYCVSFLWNGAGVALGYLISDWSEER